MADLHHGASKYQASFDCNKNVVKISSCCDGQIVLRKLPRFFLNTTPYKYTATASFLRNAGIQGLIEESRWVPGQSPE